MMRRKFDHRQGSSIYEKGTLFEHGQENSFMRRMFFYEKEAGLMREESSYMAKGLEHGKISSIMRRDVGYGKGSFYDEKKILF